MTYASGSAHGLRYVKETVFNVTPTTPTMQDIGYTSCDLKLSRGSFQSNTIRSDGQIEDITLGSDEITNGFGFEFNYGDYDDILAGVLDGEWDADILKCGQTPSSFTFERHFGDIAKDAVYTGCKIDTFNLSVQTESIITGSFGIVGAGYVPFSGTPLDPDPLATTGNPRFNAFTGTIKEGGVTIGVVSGIDLTLAMSRVLDRTIFSGRTASNVNRGRANLTGTLTAFFENETLFNKFANDTYSSLEFTIGDGVSKSYTFLIPRLKYTDADVSVDSEGSIEMSMPFQSLLDTTEATNLVITRIPGV